MRLSNGHGDRACVLADATAGIYVRDLEYDSAGLHLQSIIGSHIVIAGNCRLVGSSNYHWWASHGGKIISQPGWSGIVDPGVSCVQYFARAFALGLIHHAIQWTGGMGSAAYHVEKAGMIDTSGYGLPASGAPVNAGGWYY